MTESILFLVTLSYSSRVEFSAETCEALFVVRTNMPIAEQYILGMPCVPDNVLSEPADRAWMFQEKMRANQIHVVGERTATSKKPINPIILNEQYWRDLVQTFHDSHDVYAA